MNENVFPSFLRHPSDDNAKRLMDKMEEISRRVLHLVSAAAPRGPAGLPEEALGLWERASLIYDEYLRYETGLLKKRGFTITCNEGCWHCCRNMPMDLSFLELAVLRRRLEGAEVLPKALKRIIEAAEVWDRAQRNAQSEDEALVAYSREAACPLVDRKNGLCIVYSARPIVCRAHFATTPSEWCAPLSERFKDAVKISIWPARGVSDAVARVDERLGLTLPRSLADSFLVFALR